MPVPLLSRTDLHEVSEFANAGGEILGVEPQLNEISFLPLQGGTLAERTGRNPAAQCDRPRRTSLLKTLFPGRPAVGAFVLLNGSQV